MNYDKLIYESRPVKFDDYMMNKYDIVHNELYKDALYNYLSNRIYSLLVEDVLYNLITKFNNFITNYNDGELLNFDTLGLSNEYEILEFEDIARLTASSNFPEETKKFVNQLVVSIWEDPNCESICKAFKDLDLTSEEQDNYILFILYNILVLLYTCKTNITSIIPSIGNISNISDFIIRYDNSIYMIDEEAENFICEEDANNNEEFDEAVFIYEDMIIKDYHIGYTKTGKWILDINPSIDIMPMIDDLRNIINKTNTNLVDIVTSNMIDRFLNKHKIIEKKNTEYWQPSSIIIYSTEYPYSKTTVDLSKWWNMNQSYDNLKIENIKILEDNIKDATIEDIDYVRGKVKVYSKLYDIHYIVDFNFIKDDTEIDDELIQNTFVNKIKNLYSNS